MLFTQKNTNLIKPIIALLSLVSIFFLVQAASAATITVTGTAHTTVADGNCTLVEAIANANNDALTHADCLTAGSGTDTIVFDITGAGPHTFSPTSSYNITSPIIIDGTTAEVTTTCGAAVDLNDRSLSLEFDGAGVVGTIFDFSTGSAGSRLSGVAVGGADTSNILLEDDNITISCSHVGVGIDGSTVIHNGAGVGIALSSSDGVVIGGLNNEDRNIISGNDQGVTTVNGVVTNLLIQNNYVGVNLAGNSLIGNCRAGINLAQGDASGVIIRNNVVSGNAREDALPFCPNSFTIGSDNVQTGLHVHNSAGNGINTNVRVIDNIVGLSAAGDFAIGNAGTGIGVNDSTDVLIQGNITSANGGGGIGVTQISDVTIIGNYIGTDASGLLSFSNASDFLGYIADGLNAPLYISGSDIQVGGGAPIDRNIISGNDAINSLGAILLLPDFGAGDSSQNIRIQGNYFGVGSDGITLLPNINSNITALSGAEDILVGGTALGEPNLMYGPDAGFPLFRANVNLLYSAALPLGQLGKITILGNKIYGDVSDLGIDLYHDPIGNLDPADFVSQGPNPNDIGDTDTGPNDYLNSPVIYDASTASGNTTVNFYLDVPALSPTNGGANYRIEFFRNSTFPTNTLHGEGEEYLDAIEITHTGSGVEAFSHTLTGVTSGDIISTTVTEIEDNTPGASDLEKYGSTSEFGNTVIVESFGPDFGDAPDSYGTTATNNGPYHLIDPDVYLGSCVDADNGQLTNATATADNATSSSKATGNCIAGQDDEDGVTFESILNWGTTDSEVSIEASVDGELNAWIDFNLDGDFTDAGEQIADNEPVTAGTNTILFDVPAGSGYEATFARFRFNTTDINGVDYDLTPFGESLNGEVEDYRIFFGTPPTPSSGGSSGGSINYTCTDPEAINYSQFGRHKQSLCEYEFDLIIPQATNPTTQPTTDNEEATTTDGEATTPSSTTCPYFLTYLQKGDTGYEVAKLQDFLNKYLNLSLVVDGDYGPSTKQAVKQLQKKHASDILDPWTLKEPTGRFYKTSAGVANEIIGCQSPDVFLENVNITNSFDNDNIFKTFMGELLSVFR